MVKLNSDMNELPPRQSPPGSGVRAGKRHQVPPGTGTFGMWLFLAALTMLFAATIVAYLIFRFTSPLGEGASLTMPAAFWASTALMLIASFTMHRALQNVRHERQTRFRNALVLTLLLAVGFLLVQAPALVQLLGAHNSPEVETAMYGLVFFLVIVHALHVLGGLIPLAVITARAHRDAYDHEQHEPVTQVTLYWHFLDAVWVVMFLVLTLAG